MTTHLQTSLLDVTLQGGPALRPLAGQLTRTYLSSGAWIDLLPAWVTGSDELFLRLVETVPWYADRRTMYDRVVDVPRLLSWYGEGAELPDPLLVEARQLLDHHYHTELGEPFVTAGLCYYRDGRDSVAWHGDTIGRSRYQDTMVAFVSLGAAR
jgi:alkylated DNA repair dioxygenase AlkB